MSCKEEFIDIFKSTITREGADKLLDFLENKNCSIMQVAQMAGFESQSYYTKVFRSIMKCTPQEYRKENKRVIDTGGT